MDEPARVKRTLRILAVALVVGATAATVATVPASAQSYKVTVQLADGTLQELVLDLPEGTTLDQVAGYSTLPGTPVSLEPGSDGSPRRTEWVCRAFCTTM